MTMMMTMMIAGARVCVEIRMPSNEQQQQQQQTVVTNHDVVSRPNDADSVVHYYRTITVISTLLINGGCLCVIISIIALAVLDYFGVICDLMGGTAVSISVRLTLVVGRGVQSMLSMTLDTSSVK